MEKERTPENLEALKNLIQNDIIGSIEGNLRLGNITEDDARKLKRQTHKLYDHIYAHYNEMEDLNEMTDESLMLDIDIIEKRHEQELAKKDEEIAKSRKVIAEKDEEIACLKKLLEAAFSE
jgi:predicted RNase H-like nuclease (RuvC/YqgF family)